MQKHVNLVDLVKSFPTNIFLQNLASMQKRTSPLKFDHLAEQSKVWYRTFQLRSGPPTVRPSRNRFAEGSLVPSEARLAPLGCTNQESGQGKGRR